MVFHSTCPVARLGPALATRDVEVQDSATGVLDYEEATQSPERDCGHWKEIHGHNGLTMIIQERQPTPARITAPLDATEIPGYRALRDFEAEFEQFAMGPWVRPTLHSPPPWCG